MRDALRARLRAGGLFRRGFSAMRSGHRRNDTPGSGPCGRPAVRRRVLLLAAPPVLALRKAHGEAARAAAPAKKRGTAVLVVGATGGVGSEVLRCLREKPGQFGQVRATTRSGGRDGNAVALDVVTSADEDVAAAMDGMDAVVCAVGVHVTTTSKAAMKGTRRDTAHLVDNLGVCRLVDAAVAGNVQHFTLVSALLTNAPALGRENNRSYVTLELLGSVLSEKHDAEDHLRNACVGSNMRYTIVRPGALAGGVSDALFREDAAPLGELVGPADTFFDISAAASVRRSRVAELCVASLTDARANNRTIEFVGSRDPSDQVEDWFA